jgi:pseudouridine-5'-phosphate glycosidase
VKIGLTLDEIEFLSKGCNARKCSIRDLAFVMAKKMNGSTTVAGTMYIANCAGIKVFVTGGIGGVHRGAEETFDISADLTELAKTPVAVVSAGVKSILDIPKTLEYLETMGVPVVSFGQD